MHLEASERYAGSETYLVKIIGRILMPEHSILPGSRMAHQRDVGLAGAISYLPALCRFTWAFEVSLDIDL